eukprot:282358_1
MSTKLQNADDSLGQHYHMMGRYDYYNDKGEGKLFVFCNENGIKGDDLPEQIDDFYHCKLFEIDMAFNGTNLFPLSHPPKNEKERKEAIIEILKRCICSPYTEDRRKEVVIIYNKNFNPDLLDEPSDVIATISTGSTNKFPITPQEYLQFIKWRK